MGLGPVEAVTQALGRAGMTRRRHRPVRDQRGVRRTGRCLRRASSASPWTSSNAHGGSIALGHPFGMTGARIMTTLIHNLAESDKDLRRRDRCASAAARAWRW
ncbi:MAG: hypothetical protein V9E94_02450 [Microthrixaceae bacterium]